MKLHVFTALFMFTLACQVELQPLKPQPRGCGSSEQPDCSTSKPSVCIKVEGSIQITIDCEDKEPPQCDSPCEDEGTDESWPCPEQSGNCNEDNTDRSPCEQQSDSCDQDKSEDTTQGSSSCDQKSEGTGNSLCKYTGRQTQTNSMSPALPGTTILEQPPQGSPSPPPNTTEHGDQGLESTILPEYEPDTLEYIHPEHPPDIFPNHTEVIQAASSTESEKGLKPVDNKSGSASLPASAQPLASCVPTQSTLEKLLDLIAEGIANGHIGGFPLPPLYDVLEVSRTVNFDINIEVIVKLTDTVCGKLNLGTTTGSIDWVNNEPTWTLNSAQKESCEEIQHESRPICSPGSF